MNLSANFTLEELCKSQTAERKGIDNTPDATQIENLRRVANKILQPARDHYGMAFLPNSGFRCLALNREIGSGDNSQHILGEAVDFEIPGVPNLELAAWVQDNLEFDQLILECYKPGENSSGWVHVSIKDDGNRGDVLTYSNRVYQQGLVA